jgi:hypothetical protein
VLANGNVPAQYQTLPGGCQGTDDTVALMQQLCTGQWGSRSPKIHALALNIVRAAGVDEKDYTGEVVAIHNYVRDNIRYTKDVVGQETLYPPEEVAFNSKAGDCDDKSMLVAALLGSIGTPTRFVTIGVTPDRYSHVYLQAKPKDQWISLDPIMRDKPAGWEVPPYVVKVRKVYTENAPQELSMNGLGDSHADASAAGGVPGGSRGNSPFGWYVAYQGGGYAVSHLSSDPKPQSDGQTPYIVTDSMLDNDAPIERLSINAPAFPQQDITQIGPAAQMASIAPTLTQIVTPPLAQTQTPVDPNAGQALSDVLGQPVQAYDAWARPHVIMPDGSVSQPHWFTPSTGLPVVQAQDGSLIQPGVIPAGAAPTMTLPDGSLIAPTFNASAFPYGFQPDPNAQAPVTAGPNPYPQLTTGETYQFEQDPNAQTPVDAWGRPTASIIQRGPASTNPNGGTHGLGAMPNPYQRAFNANNPFAHASVTAGGAPNGGTVFAMRKQRSSMTPAQVAARIAADNGNEEGAHAAGMNPGVSGVGRVIMPGELADIPQTGIDRQLPFSGMQRPPLAQAPEGIDAMFTRPNMALRTDKGDTIVYKGLYALNEKPPIRPYHPSMSGLGVLHFAPGVKSLNGMGMMPARSISGPGVADLADAAAATPAGMPAAPSAPMAPAAAPSSHLKMLGVIGALGLGAYLLMRARRKSA